MSLYRDMVNYLCLRLLIHPIAQEYGVELDELIEEARRFLALSDAEQDGELAAHIEAAEAAGNAEDVRILTKGWAAIQSYRWRSPRSPAACPTRHDLPSARPTGEPSGGDRCPWGRCAGVTRLRRGGRRPS